MKCPHCQTPDLLMTTRDAIEIDYCPQCRGVWLDRGELDKILERATRYEQANFRPRNDDDDDDRRNRHYPPPPPHQSQGGYGHPQQDPRYQKKRKSFWSELFD